MASWREIERHRKSPQSCRELAAALHRAYCADLTEWETEFLGNIRALDDASEVTTRQAEKLLEIRDQNQAIPDIAGFSVAALLQGCYAARLDLSESDENWIASFIEGRKAVRRAHAARLMRCARELNLIEQDYA